MLQDGLSLEQFRESLQSVKVAVDGICIPEQEQVQEQEREQAIPANGEAAHVANPVRSKAEGGKPDPNQATVLEFTLLCPLNCSVHSSALNCSVHSTALTRRRESIKR